MNVPLPFEWDGEVMKPVARALRFCDRQFVVGETYPLVVHEDRSTNSHNHFFASVGEVWKNLPEKYSKRFATAEHLRKWILIKAGYADERSIACATPEEALRVASFIKPMDDYSIVIVADATIKVFTAKSQSPRAMDKKTFQESKQAVLDIAAEMIGVDPATLTAHSTELHSKPNSSASAPEPQTKPAPSSLASGAGATTSPDGATALSDGEPKQAGGGGDPAAINSAGLPEGWERDYIATLKAVKAFRYLPGAATKFWNERGSWEKWKGTEQGDVAAKIYLAFEQNFPDHEKRDAILRELGVA